MKQLLILLVVAITTLPSGLYAQAPTTYKYSGYVNDFANTIDDAAEAKLQADLKQFDKNTGVQLAVVTVPSLNGDEPEVFAQELFHNWGIGHKENNTGVLYLICPSEHKQRIHTGYGVESTLPDVICKRILRDTEPKMKENISSAIIARANAIVSTVSSNNDTGVNPQTAATGDQAKNTYAENPDSSVRTADSNNDGSVFGTVLLVIIAVGGSITFAIWFFNKRKQEREEKERELKNINDLLKLATSKAETVLAKCNNLLQHADATDSQKQTINKFIVELNDFQNRLDFSKTLINNKTSVDDLTDATTLANSLASTAKTIAERLSSVDADIATLSKARVANFDCEFLRKSTIQSEGMVLSERDKILRNYPASVWNEFDYKNYKENIVSLFEKLDSISDECETHQSNLNLDNARRVISLHKQYEGIKAEIEQVISTILNKTKQLEYAAGLISTNQMDEAYVTAKRNVEAQHVSSKTVARFNEAVKLCLAYRKLASTCKNPLQLASEYTSITKELGLISEKALYDVRRHKEEIEEAIRAAKRKKEQEEEDERRRQQALVAAATSYYSSSSSSSSSSYNDDSSSFSFGGGDSGGGGSNDSW